MEASRAPAACERLVRFMVVSAGGFLLQVALVVLFVERLGWPLAAGTAAAVEAAILHNWAWHEAWTWRGRGGRGGRLRRLAAFHAANGAISLAGSVVCGELLARATGLPLEVRAAIAVALTGVVNFLAADRLIFAAAGASPRPAGRRQPPV